MRSSFVQSIEAVGRILCESAGHVRQQVVRQARGSIRYGENFSATLQCKPRRGGTQKVTVKHVYGYEPAQAIMAMSSTRGLQGTVAEWASTPRAIRAQIRRWIYAGPEVSGVCNEQVVFARRKHPVGTKDGAPA